MFSYNEFKSQIAKNGVARNNRFAVNISVPLQLTEGYDIKQLMLYCTSVNLSGVNISSDAVKLYGESIEVPYDRTFSGATFSFLMSPDLKEKKLFDDWIDLIQNPNNRTFGYMDDFKAEEISIQVLDLNDEYRYEVKLYEAFPKTIGNLNLANDAAGVMSLDVSFDYRYYKTF